LKLTNPVVKLQPRPITITESKKYIRTLISQMIINIIFTSKTKGYNKPVKATGQKMSGLINLLR
jgi:hypothetical protein